MTKKKHKQPTRQNIADDTLVLILAGGRGSRLHELTDKRAKPAVYFGGCWRIIDFALSNCINSELLKIGVITQYAAHSLLRHLQRGWSFLPQERGQFIDMLPARQQIDDQTWYRGTADAVYQNANIMQEHYNPKYVVILAGDHIYKMDYMQMINDHISFGAKCTVGCIEVPREEASAFGIMAVNENLKVTSFTEKPANPPEMIDKPGFSLASMGIYVFDADYLMNTLHEEVATPNTSHDFGKDIIPRCLQDGVLYAHPFERSCMGRNTQGTTYWRDVGTLDSYWAANIDLVSETPQLDIYNPTWPIRSIPRQNVPTKFFYKGDKNHVVDNSLVAGGSVITDATISNSVLFDSVRVKSNALLEYAVILPQVCIGEDCVIKKAIVDRECDIPAGMQIGVNIEEDKKRFRVSDNGVVLVTVSMLKKLGVSQDTNDTYTR